MDASMMARMKELEKEIDISQTCYRYEPKLSDEKALSADLLEPLVQPAAINQSWSTDFMHDSASIWS